MLLLALLGLVFAGPLLGREDIALENCDDDDASSQIICGGSTGIYIDNRSNVSVFVEYTQSAGTGFECFVQAQITGLAPTWFNVTTQAVSSGTVTLDPLVFTQVGLAADSDVIYNLAINYDRIRLLCESTGTPDAGDTLRVSLYQTLI